jgi:flagellar hook-length control protein FliK
MAEAQAKYEAVAQQLGEALAQRLSAQIQRGHWQVKLHLHPQELGSIDVQLGMRGGDLMASFQASQQMTRDMLQDQMPRLREMLASAGIDVASADVNAQSGGRSGGNSTQAEARGAAPSSGADAAAAKAEPTTVRAAQANDDRGLDLWA